MHGEIAYIILGIEPGKLIQLPALVSLNTTACGADHTYHAFTVVSVFDKAALYDRLLYLFILIDQIAVDLFMYHAALCP